MGFRDLNIKTEYRSLKDNIPIVFFIPLLKESKTYNRAVGFFSSTALLEISVGLVSLAQNGGKVRLIASPYLSQEDFNAIKEGYKQRDEIIKDSLKRKLFAPKDNYEESRFNFLTHLIEQEILDIKIAITGDSDRIGFYHEKMGIFENYDGDRVVFSGSMNETGTGMTKNYETIDVYCSWKEWELDRVETKENAFEQIWNGTEPNVETLKFRDVEDEIIRKYRTSDDYDANLDNWYLKENADISVIVKKDKSPFVPDFITLRGYQKEAIEKWLKLNGRGIFDMATGTGKTFTGIAALVELAKQNSYNLGVIIACPFQHLVEQWVKELEKFNIFPIIGYSSSKQKDWKERLKNAILNQSLQVKDNLFFCFICTNATFSSEYVQSQIGRIKSPKLLLVDEAHNFGSQTLVTLLNDSYEYRLALSATFDRHYDDVGTKDLYKFFGSKCIEYTLEEAIEQEKLCKYKYYPIVINLTEKERDAYLQLTLEISKCVIKKKDGSTELNSKGKMLAIERARLVAGAKNKLIALEKTMERHRNEKHILVYCGSSKELQDYSDFTDVDSSELKQIDSAVDLLGNKLNMDVSKFTSLEKISERETLIKEFDNGNNLQVLVAIKCLDEGVDIPNIRTAFILASTSNPKEYIQRRGRVLRLAEGKEFAEIYDFVTITRPFSEVPALTEEQLEREKSLIKKELLRVYEFSRLAMNQIHSMVIISEIENIYRLNNVEIESKGRSDLWIH